MTEKEIISKIKQLRRIQARPEWTSLLKEHILREELANEKSSPLLLFLKPAIAFFAVFLIVSVFIFSQAALPGEPLYPLKKLSERSQALFIPEQQLPGYELERANKRLNEITKVVRTEQAKELGAKKVEPVLKEFQSNISRAAKILVETKATSSDPSMVKKIVEQTRKLEENKQRVEQLGVKIGQTKELDDALAQIVRQEIEKLEGNVLLSEELEQSLQQIKQDYQKGEYTAALEKILLLSYPQR